MVAGAYVKTGDKVEYYKFGCNEMASSNTQSTLGYLQIRLRYLAALSSGKLEL